MNKLIYSLLVALLLAACGKEVDEPAVASSHRDGDYSGEQLTITLDGKDLTSVSSVALHSVLINSNYKVDENGNESINPTYETTITLVGFPQAKKKSSFVTQTDLSGFSGTTTIAGVEYRFVGEFTGHPLLRHENQGLILKLYTK